MPEGHVEPEARLFLRRHPPDAFTHALHGVDERAVRHQGLVHQAEISRDGSRRGFRLELVPRLPRRERRSRDADVGQVAQEPRDDVARTVGFPLEHLAAVEFEAVLRGNLRAVKRIKRIHDLHRSRSVGGVAEHDGAQKVAAGVEKHRSQPAAPSDAAVRDAERDGYPVVQIQNARQRAVPHEVVLPPDGLVQPQTARQRRGHARIEKRRERVFGNFTREVYRALEKVPRLGVDPHGSVFVARARELFLARHPLREVLAEHFHRSQRRRVGVHARDVESPFKLGAELVQRGDDGVGVDTVRATRVDAADVRDAVAAEVALDPPVPHERRDVRGRALDARHDVALVRGRARRDGGGVNAERVGDALFCVDGDERRDDLVPPSSPSSTLARGGVVRSRILALEIHVPVPRVLWIDRVGR